MAAGPGGLFICPLPTSGGVAAHNLEHRHIHLDPREAAFSITFEFALVYRRQGHEREKICKDVKEPRREMLPK